MATHVLPSSIRSGNAFLDALPTASLEALQPYLTLRSAKSGEIVAVLGETVEEVLFPIFSVISVVASMHDGTSIEVSLKGRDGFHGLSVALGDPLSPHDAMVQIADSVLSLPPARFVHAFDEDIELRRGVLRYAQVTLHTVAQFAACNRLHPINERAARWLLMAHDRVPGDVVSLTHEFLSIMLGVRRPGVSLAAASLERAGLIDYRRGRIVINDRPGLEAAACECYAIVNDQSARLMGYDIRKN